MNISSLSWKESFEVIGCPTVDRVRLATFLLKLNAFYWWETAQQDYLDLTAILWVEFEQILYNQFYLHSYQDTKQSEFLRLNQDSMTMLEYEHKFNEKKYKWFG